MYKLKQLPEDFIVVEIPNIKPEQSGRYAYFWLEKKDRNTIDAVQELARKLGVREKDIGFAGSKDKHAVTKQLISFSGIPKEKIFSAELSNASLSFYGYGDKPISLGDLTGNTFEIVVRNLDKEKIESTDMSENYFDEQRFSEKNAEIGRHIIKKEFKPAVNMMDEYPVKKHLEEKPNDFIGALKTLPLRLLRMYVNAYQSYLWNKTVATYLRRKGKNPKMIKYTLGELVFVSDADNFKDLKIPLIGFSDEAVENKEISEIIDIVMKEEELSYPDFIIKQIPELTLEGELRKVMILVEGLKIGKKAKDELNEGKKKVKVSFSLPKGSYATMLIKKIVN